LQTFPDDAERGTAMGIALGGVVLGLTVGPTFGNIMYEKTGKELPFLLLAIFALFAGSRLNLHRQKLSMQLFNSSFCNRT
jgi:DHA1 family solute carrier family 18 vesicular amine transporter 1/2